MTDSTGSAQQIDLNRPVGANVVDRLFSPSSMHIALATYGAQPDLLNDAAAAWGAASTRLAALADILRKKAAAAADAWSGTESSVGFQRDIKRLHDTVRGLADATAGMHRMVESSAQTLTAFKAMFPYEDVSIMGGNDFVDDMIIQLYRLLTDRYAQAIEDHGPTHLTIDYPSIAGVRVDTGTEIPEATSNQADWQRGSSGSPVVGVVPANSLALDGSRDALAGSAVPDDSSHEWSSPFAPGASSHFSGEPTFPMSPDTAGSSTDSDPLGYDSPVDDTSLASYNPSGLGGGDFGVSAPDALTGTGASFGPSSGSGFGGGARAEGSPSFGMGQGPSRQISGPGMGMMPPHAGNADDDEEERTRDSWLAEDTDVWGAKDVEASPAVLGAAEPERPRRGRRVRDVADS